MQRVCYFQQYTSVNSLSKFAHYDNRAPKSCWSTLNPYLILVLWQLFILPLLACWDQFVRQFPDYWLVLFFIRVSPHLSKTVLKLLYN